jgi:hypothetical protein
VVVERTKNGASSSATSLANTIEAMVVRLIADRQSFTIMKAVFKTSRVPAAVDRLCDFSECNCSFVARFVHGIADERSVTVAT